MAFFSSKRKKESRDQSAVNVVRLAVGDVKLQVV